MDTSKSFYTMKCDFSANNSYIKLIQTEFFESSKRQHFKECLQRESSKEGTADTSKRPCNIRCESFCKQFVQYLVTVESLPRL